MKPGRVPGSRRFDPYYKAEVWDPKLSVWRPVQKAFGTDAEARGGVRAGQRGRVVTFTEKGRSTGEPFDA